MFFPGLPSARAALGLVSSRATGSWEAFATKSAPSGTVLQNAFQASVGSKAEPAQKILDAHTNEVASAQPTITLEPKVETTVNEPAMIMPEMPFIPQKPQPYVNVFTPKIVVVGVGGAGGNAVNNMIARNLQGVEFLVCNTDAQHLSTTLTDNRVQLGLDVTGGLGCGANPEMGRLAAEESSNEILEHIQDANMVFITAGMGGGTGTGAAPAIARTAMDNGMLTVAVVTKPFQFEGKHRYKLAEDGLLDLRENVDTCIVVPNQNLFSLATPDTTLMDAFRLADDVLLAGVKSITDLMVCPGLINLDFADVETVMQGMGNAMMGTGEASGDDRAIKAADDALRNPLLGDLSVRSAKGMLVSITGGPDMTLFEVDKAANKITEEVEDLDANIIFGSTYDNTMEGKLRVCVVATGIDEM